MEVIIKHDEEISDYQTGDYEVRFYCDESVIVTYAQSINAERALEQAKERVQHILKIAKPEMAQIELKGVWG